MPIIFVHHYHLSFISMELSDFYNLKDEKEFVIVRKHLSYVQTSLVFCGLIFLRDMFTLDPPKQTKGINFIK